MSGKKFAATRATSRLREGFEVAAAGATKELGAEVYPANTVPTAAEKVRRSVAPDGDLNPTWTLLEAVAARNPGPVLEALGEVAGLEVEWRPVPASPEVIGERILARQRELEHTIEELRREFEAFAQTQRPRTMHEVLRRGRVA